MNMKSRLKKKAAAGLLALVVALGLMPAQTAWAYQEGDTCPDCKNGRLIVLAARETQHAFECTNANCEHRGHENWIWEDHWGGTATCTNKARCQGCHGPDAIGKEYGDLDPDNHTGTSTVTGKKVATCTEAGYTGDTTWDCCGKKVEGETIAALGHSWGAWTVTKEATTSEEVIETRVCKNDSTHTETRAIPKKEETKKEETKDEETKKEEPKKEAAKAETVSKTTDTQPQTGDESQTVWVIMMMLSAAVLIVLAIRKRRVFD